jgi:hypothetical protein
MNSKIASLLTTISICLLLGAGFDCTTVIAQNQTNEELQFVESDGFKSKDGKFFHVKGTIRNISKSRAVKMVKVTVIIYDKENKELETKTVPLTPEVLKPGEEGTFEVVTKYHDKMHGYQKTVKWKVRKW